MNMQNRFRGMNVLFFSAVILIADQATKLMVKGRFALYDKISIIGDFFRLTYIENPNMAFGISPDHPAFVTTLAAIGGIAFFAALYRACHRLRKAVWVTGLAAVAGIAMFVLLRELLQRMSSATFFKAFATIASGVILVYLYLIRHEKFIARFALAIILGGAIGNLIDRFAYGQVVDFLDFGIGNTRWPIFNVADSSVTIGMILLLSLALFEKEPDKAAMTVVSIDNAAEPTDPEKLRRKSE